MGGRIGIVDGYNLTVRHFVANPTMDRNGNPIGVVVGSLRSISHFIRETKLTDVIVVWDGEGGSSRRRSIYAEYKAGRRVRLNREFDSADGPAEDMQNRIWQEDTLKRYLDMLGVMQVQVPGCEADDVIAYYARECLTDAALYIMTNDKDMLQLVRPGCVIYNPTKKRMYDMATVQAEWFSLPENLPIVRAIAGDGSDNIDGVHGIGNKGATLLFPCLNQRVCKLDDLLDECEATLREVESGTRKMSKSAQEKRIKFLQSEQTIRRNLQLMKLDGSMLPAPAARSARLALERRPPFTPTQFRMTVIREGTGTKEDLLTEFTNMNMRRNFAEKAKK